MNIRNFTIRVAPGQDAAFLRAQERVATERGLQRPAPAAPADPNSAATDTLPTGPSTGSH